ncbi:MULTISPECIES: BrnT family toxin [unclassified Synechocystis]|uniref:BrnT family toxin n=1 Tax=unclassified Synechocystis TaxID=2640012 RepID=UPI0004296A77|nr:MULTISPECIES: BrnT family toxin [unclassified Synechocystis]AIE75606.1 hypothetical protein D082_30780 [Synechocystis sp. PCC 6714]MCT0253801.1 BrnT family toxin [Synechocystis sp. CS-94]
MYEFRWNSEKNEWLKQNRRVSFEQIVKAVQNDDVLADVENPNQEKYPHQYMLIVKISDYVYCVPYVKDGSTHFFKTIFPSRKMTKFYLGS